MKEYNHYYRFFTETPFAGTDTTKFIASDEEYEIDEDEIREDLYASYGYCINGFFGDDPTEEEYESFIEDCTVIFEETTKEEFEMAIENGYHYEIH